ncbi:arginine decarboxylase [Prochlorococcus marinus str. MIT 9312]|uniref:Biosynthetic arginine decarboxylase n=1 Tax=Prochlorococcus marinus (strain MIT 9312) TaxID=74546 RepID=SPEA_PROM9|nr:biosynthetic arginine decarboxylase [Prochlorococcus marinus]Q31DD8.1 RecName: Full=Biosynthetic arginine decarboxylase; Short=ADC [Prochlorococcus marinus str. MIT 9312]ABB49107.1 arginine decarboxylase [Prochlorococcus marinus str. MIT 9312]KGF99656.1 Biosynthetic arginine decarboxylase [Prochlorococcus marinus str. MIT 9311]
MTNFEPKKLKNIWTIEDSISTYNIDKWGDKYFSINSKGNISVTKDIKSENKIDLFKLVKELKSREINPPLIIRFNDILKDRINALHDSFFKAIKTYKYKNIYQGVFPVKCNQQKNVLEKIIEFGSQWNFGLEVGSKSELLIGLALLENQNSLLICNGYKDKKYIEIATLARKLGKNPIIVIEQRDEVKRIIQAVQELNATPLIGIRAKLSSKSSGRWGKSIGDNSKFGLSIPEIMLTIKELKEANLINEMKLLHFHIGSQISDIAVIKDALQEASQIYVELCKLGAPMQYIDVGGGLGIDFDGTKTSSNTSTNYSLQNYANDVIATIKDSCELNNIKHPIIISESGRAIISHCSVLIFNVLGTSHVSSKLQIFDKKNQQLIISNLLETFYELKKLKNKKINLSQIIELWNDAKKFKEDCLVAFRLGFLSLAERAYAEELTWACAKEISKNLNNDAINHPDLSEITETLASTYYANLSIFKSIPDSWAINQIFPIVPIHRHLEEPFCKGNFADLTCDSDGKLNNFIDDGKIKSLLNLHKPEEDKDYLIGIFMTGAYQEALGNLHNLFGSTNVVHIDINQDNSYKVKNIIKEDSKSEILQLLDYSSASLVESIRINTESAIDQKKLTIEEARKLMDQIEISLRKSSYLSE